MTALAIRGGHLLDPAAGVDGLRDILFKDNRVAEIAAPGKLKLANGAETLDAKGLVVAPGLVDIHTHVYAGTGLRGAYDGDNSVYPDGFTFRSCVTTVADVRRRVPLTRELVDVRDRVGALGPDDATIEQRAPAGVLVWRTTWTQSQRTSA